MANKLERQSLFSWEQAVSDPLDRQEARTKMKNWKIRGSSSQVGKKNRKRVKHFVLFFYRGYSGLFYWLYWRKFQR